MIVLRKLFSEKADNTLKSLWDLIPENRKYSKSGSVFNSYIDQDLNPSEVSTARKVCTSLEKYLKEYAERDAKEMKVNQNSYFNNARVDGLYLEKEGNEVCLGILVVQSSDPTEPEEIFVSLKSGEIVKIDWV